MSSGISSERFLGLDTAWFVREFGVALQGILGWPILRWLSPRYFTRCVELGGSVFDIVEGKGGVGTVCPATRDAKFLGVVIPEKMVLWSRVKLPALTADELASAVELEAKSLSPFNVEELLWASLPFESIPGGVGTSVAILSKRMVEQHVASLPKDERHASQPEVWLRAPNSHEFLLLHGFGEARRKVQTSQWTRFNWFLAILLLSLLGANSVTPTAKLRLQALQAVEDFERVQRVAAPALRMREQLLQVNEQGRALEVLMDKALAPELILLRLTKLLGDDTYLTSLRVQGNKIAISGQTPNTAVFMQQLGAQAGVRDVKSPLAATKQRGAEREYFTVEFSMEGSESMGGP